MEKKVIMLDSDGVIVNLPKHWASVYNERYNDTLAPEELCEYWDGIENVVKPECGDKIYDLLKEAGFFQNCEAYDGAIETFKAMCEDPMLDCYILSAYSGHPESARGKLEWYNENCPFFDSEKLILCKPKHLVYGDVLVDDSYKNVKQFVNANLSGSAIGLMMAATHNEDSVDATEVSLRPQNLAEAYEYIKSVVLV